MKKTAFLFLLLASLSVSAQTVLLKVDRNEDRKVSDHGPNLKSFTHFYLRGAMLASEDKPGARIIYGPSVNLALGVRVKFKVGDVYSLGYEIEAEYTDYKFKQEEGKLVPDTLIHKMNRLDYYSLSAGFYNRFNFDPNRGNFTGTFLDLGINGEWHYSIKSVAKDNMPDGTKQKTVTKNLGYVNNINARLFARLGFNHTSLYVSYRLMDVFKSGNSYPELPQIVAGIDLGLF